MNAAQKYKLLIVNIISVVLLLVGALLSVSDQLKELPFVSPEIAQLWPQVLAVAAIVQRVGTIILEGLTKTLLVLFCLGSLAGCAGSGPNGEWTPQDTDASIRSIYGAYDAQQRIRYPDRYYPQAPTTTVVVPPR